MLCLMNILELKNDRDETQSMKNASYFHSWRLEHVGLTKLGLALWQDHRIDDMDDTVGCLDICFDDLGIVDHHNAVLHLDLNF